MLLALQNGFKKLRLQFTAYYLISIMATQRGRAFGQVNYKKEVVVDAVASVLPAGAEAWRMAAACYWHLSNETSVRDHTGEEEMFIFILILIINY